MDSRNTQGSDHIDYRENAEDLTEVHAAIEREHRDPSADVTPIPLWLAGVCGAALVWGAGYFGVFHGGFRSDVFNERFSSPDLLFPQPVAATGAGAAAQAEAGPSLVQAGKAVFSNCQPCHQASGQGIPGQFPTLVNTDYVKAEKRLLAVLLKGAQGPMDVGGVKYNGAMPAWEKTLNDKKIAQVASYVRASFGNSFPEISEAKVAAARKELAAHTQPMTEAELLQLPADITTADAGGVPAGGATAAPASGGGAAQAAAPAVDLRELGKKQYAAICGACHQPTGLGLPGAFPPLAKSEYVTEDPKRLIAIILKGVMGPITVDGKPFNSMMPGQGAMLTDKHLAGIATYVRKSFGNSASDVTPEVVAAVRKELQTRNTPFTEAELKSFGGSGGSAPVAPATGAAPAP